MLHCRLIGASKGRTCTTLGAVMPPNVVFAVWGSLAARFDAASLSPRKTTFSVGLLAVASARWHARKGSSIVGCLLNRRSPKMAAGMWRSAKQALGLGARAYASASVPERKVAVLGAAGGIGQPLGLLMKVCQLHDMSNS